MSHDVDLEALEAELQSVSLAHRAFFVPIVRAVACLGGRARKREVVAELRRMLASELTPGQLDYLERKDRYSWARYTLEERGVVGGEYGYWELTPLGQEYEAAHRQDLLSIDLEVPESATRASSTVRTEPITVTNSRAYDVPVLQVLADGLTERRQISDAVGERLKETLKPGDHRRMPSGHPVWAYRVAWTLSTLGKAGFVENTGTGQWRITDAGLQRLAREIDAWDIRAFPPAQSMVQVEGATPPSDLPPDPWDQRSWERLRTQMPKVLFVQLSERMRLDLGPSPVEPFARNIILYGPPGGGKTYRAKQIARALTGDEEAGEDGRFRLVQFHPSYAYEDFVQGLRPDLKATDLRYELHRGPFLSIADAAHQDPNAMFVLLIDEINRGDPARIFGELLYALEYRDEPVSLPLGGELVVPSNLIVLGTMNSVDRSVALVDYALRRRFSFIRIDPDPSVIANRPGLLGETGPEVLANFNAWVAKRLGREHVIGHSYFLSRALPTDDARAFARLWSLDVRPLMEEYFYGDEDGLREAEDRWTSIVSSALQTRETLREESRDDVEAPAP